MIPHREVLVLRGVFVQLSRGAVGRPSIARDKV